MTVIRAPAKAILCGEHFVLHGAPAVAIPLPGLWLALERGLARPQAPLRAAWEVARAAFGGVPYHNTRPIIFASSGLCSSASFKFVNGPRHTYTRLEGLLSAASRIRRPASRIPPTGTTASPNCAQSRPVAFVRNAGARAPSDRPMPTATPSSFRNPSIRQTFVAPTSGGLAPSLVTTASTFTYGQFNNSARARASSAAMSVSTSTAGPVCARAPVGTSANNPASIQAAAFLQFIRFSCCVILPLQYEISTRS